MANHTKCDGRLHAHFINGRCFQVKRGICEWLAWILRVKRPGKNPKDPQRRKSFMKGNKMRDVELRERCSKSLLANVLDLDDDFRSLGAHSNSTSNHNYTSIHTESDYRAHHHNHGNDYCNNAPPSYRTVSRTDPEGETSQTILKDILKELQFLSAKKREDDEFMDTCNDWKFAAIVVDRFCLWLFTVFTIVSTCAILFSAPHVFS